MSKDVWGRNLYWVCGLLVSVGSVAVTRGQSFSIAVLPDTQNYARSNTTSVGGPNDYFAMQTRWIVNNAASHNIKFATHLGDVVNNAGAAGGAANPQWGVAVNAMNVLKGSSVPYSILPGNHDWSSLEGYGSLEHYRVRFGNTSSFFAGKSWFLGYDERGVNTAQRFSTPAGDFLNISLEFNSGAPAMSSDAAPGTPANAMAWAQAIINANPGIPTIISTHDNVNTSGTRAFESVRMLDNLVRKNDQVFMVLNGHYSSAEVTEESIISKNDYGHPVYEILTDYQARNRGGDGWMRLMKFDWQNNKIVFQTYTPVSSAVDGVPAGPEFGNTGRVETDSDSQFELPLNVAQRYKVRRYVPTQTYTFQQGVDGYAGTEDTQVRSDAPGTTYGNTTNIGVDGDNDSDTTNGSVQRASLIKFNGIFDGSSGGTMIPEGRDIVSAKLVLNLNAAANADAEGSGARIHRMLAAWAEGTATWNNLGTSGDGIATAVDATGRADSERGDNMGSAAVASGLLELNVTASVRAWLNGAVNQGWVLNPWLPKGSNGIFFDSSEASGLGAFAPQLVVEVTADRVVTKRFQNGVGGYNGTVDTYISQAAPGVAYGNATTLRVDKSTGAVGEGDQVGLVKFGGIGLLEGGSIPAGATVTSAILKLEVPASVANSTGSYVEVYRLLRPFGANDTWTSLVDGIEVGVETMTHPEDFAGLEEGGLGIGNGILYLDVTDSVQAWVDGEANYGWALVTNINGTDAVFFSSSESGGFKPELVVRYTAFGVWVPEPEAVVWLGVAMLGLGRVGR